MCDLSLQTLQTGQKLSAVASSLKTALLLHTIPMSLKQGFAHCEIINIISLSANKNFARSAKVSPQAQWSNTNSSTHVLLHNTSNLGMRWPSHQMSSSDLLMISSYLQWPENITFTNLLLWYTLCLWGALSIVPIDLSLEPPNDLQMTSSGL